MFCGIWVTYRRWPTSYYTVKPFKIVSRTSGPISVKLGVYHLELISIIICSNDDPRLTLTYFRAMSNSVVT